MHFLATYFHNWDPIIFQIGPLALRWYGLSYLAGFIAAIGLLKFLHKKKLYPIGGAQVTDFVVYAAVFAVMIGGRLGYFFFYWLPENGFQAWMNDFFIFLRVWEGGMASHGGFLGLILYTLYYARKHKLSWPKIADGLCVVGPLGIGFGRLANFINGELYGRIVHNFSGSMLFPQELLTSDAGIRGTTALYAAGSHIPQELANASYNTQMHWLINEARENPEITRILAQFCEPRYPSQLYQAAMEGFGLFIILLATRLLWKKAPVGFLTGMLFIFYAAFRVIGEQFRQPDSSLIGALTKGQFYSLFMILIGLCFILWSIKNVIKLKNEPSK